MEAQLSPLLQSLWDFHGPSASHWARLQISLLPGLLSFVTDQHHTPATESDRGFLGHQDTHLQFLQGLFADRASSGKRGAPHDFQGTKTFLSTS